MFLLVRTPKWLDIRREQAISLLALDDGTYSIKLGERLFPLNGVEMKRGLFLQNDDFAFVEKKYFISKFVK
jgi:hypothetical protein